MSSVTPITSKGYAMRDASRNPSGPFATSRSPAQPAPGESVESEPLGEAAFTDLLNRYQWPLYAFLRGFVRNDEHARDLTQDVFCDAWRAALRAAPPFVAAQNQTRSDDDAIRRWLFHTAYQRAVSALRRRNLIQWESLDAQTEGVVGVQSGASPGPPGPPEHRGQHGGSSTAFAEPFTESFEDQVIEGQALGAALATLAPEDVATLLLSVVHGFTTTEIAQVIDATPSAAKKRLSRAKQRLRERYLAQNADANTGYTPYAMQSSSPTAREEPRS